MDVFVSPHNDDETLWGAYTCLRYKPLIVVVLRSFVESTWYPSIQHEIREAETACAAKILGCKYVQWPHADSNPDWEAVRGDLVSLKPERVWAPLPEHSGHAHHNFIGELCGELWPQTQFYATYTYSEGKSFRGARVQPKDGWEEVKREAMRCYVSQATHHNTHLPFDTWPIDEYLS